jgi:hypothetical protein
MSRENWRSAQSTRQLAMRSTSAEANTKTKSTIRARNGSGQELRIPGAALKPARSAAGLFRTLDIRYAT